MDEITKQIEEMAEKMEKSSTDPKEKLFTVIKSLGPKGLKEKLATLSDEEKVVLKSALEEMSLKKAVSFDDVYQAKFVQGNIQDTIIQEDKADDDQDEKLVKPAAAKMDHQGTPTDGWQGQVIKSIEENDEQLETFISKAMDKCMGDEKMVKEKLSKKGMDEKKVQGAIDKYKEKKMKKSETDEIEKGKKEEAAKKIMSMEEKEHGTKDPKKLVAAEKKEHKMKKSEDDEIEKAKMNKEEDQVGDAPNLEGGKQMAKKSPAPDIEDNAKANKKNMTKSLTWEDDNRLFKANSLGRNHSFNVEQFIEQTLANPTQLEPVKKSEGKDDLNDIIAKSEDKSWNQVNREREASSHKTSGTLVKSFEDNDLAAILGLSEDEAKKILG